MRLYIVLLAFLPLAAAFTSGGVLPPPSQAIFASRLGATSVATNDVITADSPAAASSFTSPTFQVYIEDTDAYGVMYNSNYLRSYERALSHVPREDEDDINDSSSCISRWILSSIDNQRFRSSPALGEEYIVRGVLVTKEAGEAGEEVWQVEMITKSSDGGEDDVNNDGDNWTIHNSATATLTRSNKHNIATKNLFNEPIVEDDSENLGTIFEQNITPYHDEFDMHLHTHPQQSGSFHIPLRSAMNYFERSRTSYLGGPSSLRKMQVEDDILWVVTGVEDGELFVDTVALEHYLDGGDDERKNDGEVLQLLDGGLDHNMHPLPGREVVVQTNFVTKRRGMIVDCEHRLYMNVDSSIDGQKMGRSRRLLAQATVTVMALKGSTRRPTSKLPQWIFDRIMGLD